MTVNYVAVGISAGYRDLPGPQYNVWSSEDAVTWDPVTLPAGYLNQLWLYAVTWTGTVWVAVGVGGVPQAVVYSSDGVNWQAGTWPSSVQWASFGQVLLQSCNGLAVVTGVSDIATGNAVVMYSADGNNWDISTTPPFVDYGPDMSPLPPFSGNNTGALQAAYFDGQYLISVPCGATDSNNTPYTFPILNATTDFVNWTTMGPSPPTSAVGAGALRAGVAASGSLVVGGWQSPEIVTSTDLSLWTVPYVYTLSDKLYQTDETIGSGGTTGQVVWSVNSKFFATYTNQFPSTSGMAYSPDGQNWTACVVPGGLGSGNFFQGPPCWDGRNYWGQVIYANDDCHVWKSADGINWSDVATPWPATVNSQANQGMACKTLTAIPPIRQYPRDDNLGLGAPRQRSMRNGPTSFQNSYRQYPRGSYA